MTIEILFWSLAGTIVYVYAGYPLLLVLLAALRGGRPPAHGTDEPSVTLVVSAFNEESVIAEKIRNSLALDYPSDRLQIMIVSDFSDDGTDAVVESFASSGVELLRMPRRGGKTLGLNEAVARARGDIIVFSDANAMYARNTVRMLVRNFSDPKIGAVIGESTYTDPEVESERSEGLYWKYETGIKRLETAIGSVVGGDGAIYAIRRVLYTPMRADALSDFVNPLQIVRAGHRVVYEPQAQSFEKAAEDFAKEFRRKVRIVNRGWRAMWRLSELLNPFRHGLFAWQLISHKLLRWLVPVLMVGAFVTNAVLAGYSPFYSVLLIGQTTFYVLAFFGYLMRGRASIPSVLSVPYYFCLVNTASALGIIDAYRGKTYTTWATPRAAAPAPEPKKEEA